MTDSSRNGSLSMHPYNRLIRLTLTIAICLGVPLAFAARPAYAASIIVNTSADEDNSDGDCSLREAVKAANTNAVVDACTAGEVSSDTITFSGVTSITLNSPIAITSSLTIDGGVDGVAISNPTNGRVFAITGSGPGTPPPAPYDITLNKLTISGSAAQGHGGISASSNANVAITNSTFTDNGAGQVNNPGLTSRGGAINSDRVVMTISDTVFANNFAGEAGGAVAVEGGDGTLLSSVTMTNVRMTGNTAGENGGALYSAGGLTCNRCEISDNTTVQSSSSNGGAVYLPGGLSQLFNVTISGNSSADLSNGVGGVLVKGGSHIFSNVTIAGNTGRGAAAAGGLVLGPADDPSTQVIINNTLIGDNLVGAVASDTATVPSASLASPQISSGGSNLIETPGTTTFFVPVGVEPDILGVDPLLSPLGEHSAPQINGVTQQTQALLPDSPAIDRIPFGICPPTDQRGVPRASKGSACDIGAFESSGFTIDKVAGDAQSAGLNTAFGSPLVVSVTPAVAGEPVDGGQVVFTGPASGAGIQNSPRTITIASGQASADVAANGTAGTYNVTATARGANSVSFSLTNSVVPVPGYSSNPASGSTISLTSLRGVARTSAINVTNSGTATLNVTNAAISGPNAAVFSVSPTTLSLAGGANGTLTVGCTPPAVGSYSATLTVTHNAGSAATYTLSCRAYGAYLPLVFR